MNLVLISTSNASTDRSEALSRMLASVAATHDARPDLRVRLFLLLQEADPAAPLPITKEHLAFTQVIIEKHQLSLSRARNKLLEQARSIAITNDSVVAFPDDDCWYPSGTLDGIMDIFAQDLKLDFWFCRYASSPVPLERSLERPASVVDVVRGASSNTIVMRGRLVKAMDGFDEDLGVGTPRNGGEDTNYAVAGFRRSARTIFLDAPCIGHRDHNRTLRAKYYPAALLVIARHSGHGNDLTMELLRKIAVGVVLVYRRELAFKAFLKALRDAIHEVRLAK